MPRARRSGGYMSPAAVLIRSVTAPAIPANAKPVMSATPEPQWVPTAARRVADRAEEETDDDHGDAAETVHRAPGWEGGQRRGRQEDRRACAEQRPESGHEDERQGQHRGAELQDCRVERLDDRQGRGVPRDREALLRQARPARARNSCAPPCDGCRIPAVPSAASATRPTGTTRRPAATSSRNGRDASISSARRATVGGRLAGPVRMRRNNVPEQHVLRRGRARRARGGRSSPRPPPARCQSAGARR